jgi:hypothetical protein
MSPEMVMGGVGQLNPLMTDMARQYGDAVDTAYVCKKIGLLFFQFTHKVSGVEIR